MRRFLSVTLMLFPLTLCSGALPLAPGGMLYAKSVTIQVVQAGGLSICEETYAIEDAVLNAMFDLGHIVTNEMPAQEKSKSTAINKVIDRAAAGGSDYFVRFVVRYKSKTHAPEAVLMENIDSIDWEVYDTRTRQKMHDGKEKAVMPKTDSAEAVARFATEVCKNAFAFASKH